MNSKDIEILIEKYLNGETTPEEEKALAVEVSREDAPQEWKIIAEMLGELAIDEALYDKMMAERKPKRRTMKLWPWVAAACVAAILLMIPTPPKSPLTSEQENSVEGQQVAKVEEVEPKLSAHVKPEEKVLIAEAKEDFKGVKEVKVASETIETVETAEPFETNETTDPLETNEPVPEPTRATEDIFDATLASVRRATLQKMMSCDMQCMNEDINLRANHLSTLILEQNQ